MNKLGDQTDSFYHSHRILSYVYKYLTHELEAHMSYDLFFWGGVEAPPPFHALISLCPRTPGSTVDNLGEGIS